MRLNNPQKRHSKVVSVISLVVFYFAVFFELFIRREISLGRADIFNDIIYKSKWIILSFGRMFRIHEGRIHGRSQCLRNNTFTRFGTFMLDLP